MSQVAMLSTDVGAALELRECASRWHDEPPSSEELGLLVVRAVHMAGILQRGWQLSTRDGGGWEASQYTQRIRAIEFLAQTVVDILTKAQHIVAFAGNKHPEWVAPPEAVELPSNLAAAREIARQARELMVWLDRPRPPFNEEMVRRSRESLSKGEGELIDEMIARIQAGGPLAKE